MTNRLFQIIVFLALATLILSASLTSCGTKTITEVDTVRVVKTDTLTQFRSTDPPIVRFVSLLPDRSPIVLYRDAAKTSIFAGATATLSNSYAPIPPDSSIQLYTDYFQNGIRLLDSVTVPALPRGSITTFSLYLFTSGGFNKIQSSHVSDSLKGTSVPRGYCYLRFMNGMAFWPGAQPYCYADIDTLTHSLYIDSNKVSQTISYGQLSYYARVPAGTHTVIIRDPDSGRQLYYTVVTFVDGLFYSAQVTGVIANKTDALTVYQE